MLELAARFTFYKHLMVQMVDIVEVLTLLKRLAYICTNYKDAVEDGDAAHAPAQPQGQKPPHTKRHCCILS